MAIWGGLGGRQFFLALAAGLSIFSLGVYPRVNMDFPARPLPG